MAQPFLPPWTQRSGSNAPENTTTAINTAMNSTFGGCSRTTNGLSVLDLVVICNPQRAKQRDDLHYTQPRSRCRLQRRSGSSVAPPRIPEAEEGKCEPNSTVIAVMIPPGNPEEDAPVVVPGDRVGSLLGSSFPVIRLLTSAGAVYPGHLLLRPLVDDVPQLLKSGRLNADQTGERMI